ERRSMEVRGETDPERGPEELLDPGIERAEDAVELVLGDRVVGELADEEHRILLTDRERGAIELHVASQQVLVELCVVLLGRGHDIGLVVQRALSKREPDREGVLLLTLHADEPTTLITITAINR